jgi:hypothetical protein
VSKLLALTIMAQYGGCGLSRPHVDHSARVAKAVGAQRSWETTDIPYVAVEAWRDHSHVRSGNRRPQKRWRAV